MSRRVLKAAQAIREVVSMAIIADLKDPRIQDVTVTFVEVAADMRLAKVHVSVMGDDTKQELCLKGLQSSAGYLQQKVGRRVDTRYTPRIEFVLDKGIKNAMVVTQILEEVLPNEQADPSESESNGGDAPDAIADSVDGSGAETSDQSSVDSVGPGSVDSGST